GGAYASAIWEIERCPLARCRTTMTKFGLKVPDAQTRPMGQLIVRADPACDLRFEFRFARPSYARFSVNGFAVAPMIETTMAFTVPRAHLAGGIAMVEIENMMPLVLGVPLLVSSLDLTPVCAAP